MANTSHSSKIRLRLRLYPTFTRPQFSAIYSLSDFLREVAEELEYVARLLERKSATK